MLGHQAKLLRKLKEPMRSEPRELISYLVGLEMSFPRVQNLEARVVEKA